MVKVPEGQFSQEFVDGMRDRVIMGFYRYGPAKNQFPAKVNALQTMELRLRKYKETKNTEYLMDAANFLMFEFMYPSLEGAHFTPTDNDASPGYIDNTGRQRKAR